MFISFAGPIDFPLLWLRSAAPVSDPTGRHGKTCLLVGGAVAVALIGIRWPTIQSNGINAYLGCGEQTRQTRNLPIRTGRAALSWETVKCSASGVARLFLAA